MIELKKISPLIWEIPKQGGMKVPGRVLASESLVKKMQEDKTLEQVRNVAYLPGIYKYSMVLPDGHQGYGFPIGGIAALDIKEGGISPGGVGYDINCGVRLVKTPLKKDQVQPKLRELLNILFKNVPSGVGESARVKLSFSQLEEVIKKGARWAVENGYGLKKDLERIEENGELKQADSSLVSDKAKKRGAPQCGCLGAGNHFLEVEYVGRIFRPEIAEKFGLQTDQVCIMIHTGSRGFGHQICTDYLREIERKHKEVLTKLPDRELVFAPAGSEEAEKYFKAMCAGANFAWANRQLITHWARKSFQEVFGINYEDIEILYDVAHNIAKKEEHKVNGEKKWVYVHRKGATRAFPPGNPEIPKIYKDTGQPVLIPGDMGTGSYVLAGNEKSMEISFGSTAHGAGRLLSRTKAKKEYWGETVTKELEKKGILVKAASMKVVAEEAPGAYKNLDEVVNVSDKIGIANIVVKLDPIGVVKG
jgi:tRNA-splicing ligase RtcB